MYLPGVPGGEAVAKETGLEYFSVPVELGVGFFRPSFLAETSLTPYQPSGAQNATNPLSNIDTNEKKLLQKCYEGLKGNIEKGVGFANNPPAK